MVIARLLGTEPTSLRPGRAGPFANLAERANDSRATTAVVKTRLLVTETASLVIGGALELANLTGLTARDPVLFTVTTARPSATELLGNGTEAYP